MSVESGIDSEPWWKLLDPQKRLSDPKELLNCGKIVGSERIVELWKNCRIRKKRNDADPCTERFENLCCWKENPVGLFEGLFADLNSLTCVKYLDPGKLMRIRTYGSSDRKVLRMRKWRRLKWKQRPEPGKRGSEIRFQIGFGSAPEKTIRSASKKYGSAHVGYRYVPT